VRTGRSVTQKPLLLVPIQRQLDGAREPRRAQVDRLLAFEDRFDDVGSQEGEGDQPPNIALGDALALGAMAWSERARPVARSSNQR